MTTEEKDQRIADLEGEVAKLREILRVKSGLPSGMARVEINTSKYLEGSIEIIVTAPGMNEGMIARQVWKRYSNSLKEIGLVATLENVRMTAKL